MLWSQQYEVQTSAACGREPGGLKDAYCPFSTTEVDSFYEHLPGPHFGVWKLLWETSGTPNSLTPEAPAFCP